MKSRRGLSSVVGMVFAIIAIVTTVGYVTFSLNTLDSFNQSVLARNQMSIDTIKEKFDIYGVSITNNGKFNVTISNTGSLPINITRMWVQNTTTNVVDWNNGYTCHNCIVSPGSILKNIGQNMPVGGNLAYTYNLKLITSRGNSMQFSMGSPGVKPLFLRLQMIPSSIRPFDNATLFLTVTNNMTSNNYLTNISPSQPVCTPSASFLLKPTTPTPTNYTYLQNGGTASFEWTGTATTAVNNTKITCSTYLNRAPSVTVSDSSLVITSARGQNKFNMANTGLLIRSPNTAFSTTIAGGAVTANRTLNTPVLTQTETIAVQPTITYSSPANQTGTASTSGVMDGLGVTITPHVTGRIHIVITGAMSSSTANDGVLAEIRYGTGSAPANGAALTGTAVGSNLRANDIRATNDLQPFALNGYVTGLTVGTTYWIDCKIAAITGGTASLVNVNVFVVET